MQTLTLTRPDDWHLNVRDGEKIIRDVAPYSARQFDRALITPNLDLPVTTVDLALAYRRRILAALMQEKAYFTPLMTLYLTDSTLPEEIGRAAKEVNIVACKFYPLGATTNSQEGVSNVEKIYPVLEAMQREGMVLCVHGEVTDPSVDIFDREARFIDDVLIPLRHDFPRLKIVMEHITTMEAAEYIFACNSRLLGATITAHHLLYNRNAIFKGGLHYRLPALKHEHHRQALVNAATSGAPFFFLGTDSAPHSIGAEEASCFTGLHAMELYATAFEAAGALEKLEGFASHHGPDFYGLARNTGTITLEKKTWVVPETLPFGETVLKPLCAGETLRWRLISRN